MRIAFVGKGGSGKTTCAALFAQYALRNTGGHVWAIDADLNMHMAGQLKLETAGLKHLSDPEAEQDIKRYLLGKNGRIEELSHFKKTTPPAEGSHFIWVKSPDDYVLKNYALRRDRLFLSVVGSYRADDIGASCYHNNLAVLESMLSHTVDGGSTVIVDMVAGVDAFAGTLHAQFDTIVLIVEPTQKSMEVYRQYKSLSKAAGVWQEVLVIGNKAASEEDADFIGKHIEKTKLVGSLRLSDHIKRVERGEDDLDLARLEEPDQKIFSDIYQRSSTARTSLNERLAKLHALHKKYVLQGHVRDRFGDLSGQIDESFNFDEAVRRHG